MVTSRLPAWLENRDGKIVPDPDRVRIVKNMFAWCLNGLGLSLIVKRLTESGIPNFGRGSHWTKAYIHKTLTSRVVLGEYQPSVTGSRLVHPFSATIGRSSPRIRGNWCKPH